ncbi:MAG: hypothetical protein IJ242_01990, partial [Clostridia bacterium]|nr:hypothetical protein [Clostridia bacterium]
MKKNIWLQMFCLVLLLMALLMTPCGMAETYNAQIVFRDAEGNEYSYYDLQPVVTSAGDTAYWFNMYALDEQTYGLLQSGNSVIRAYNAETGEQIPDTVIPADSGIGIMYEGETVHRSDIWNEMGRFAVLSSYQDAPWDPAEIDFTLGQLGFEVQPYIEEPEPTEVPTPEPTEVPTPEPTEVPTPEPTEVPTPEPTEVPTP